MKIGTRAHKELFCRSLIATHRAYDPEAIEWPDLPTETLERLRSLPFWGEALGTEQETGRKITEYASAVRDPLLREAIAVQGAEEVRHARILEAMLRHYQIPVTPRVALALPDDLEEAFVDAGYGECVDSFFAFGLFAFARGAGIFPPVLLDRVEPIVAEEARHIVFFANWEAYEQVHRRRGLKAIRAARALRYYLRAVRRRLGAFRNTGGSGFTVSGARSMALDVTPESFLEICLRENGRRLVAFDPDLLRPRLVPALARTTLRGLRLRPRRAPLA
ncbi:MAG: ferritin-like domain-containing protein [Candidatus Rokubacteria bacterium]|nr:ferritin-like domain-containing protein [Candidatus Rokubacteria bacterium]